MKERMDELWLIKIKPFCLGCHYCALECPTHAIDYVGTQYQINPEKCVECGKCVEVCNVSAIDTGKPEQVVPHAPTQLEADCVVIGAGAGGTVAAVKLAELTGKKIIVLEKAKRYGGSGWFASFMISNGEMRGPGRSGRSAPGGPGGPESGPGGTPMPDKSFLEKLDQNLIANAKQAGKELNDWLLEMPEVQPYLVETEVRGKKVKSLTEDRIFFNQKSTDGSIGPGQGRQLPD